MKTGILKDVVTGEPLTYNGGIDHLEVMANGESRTRPIKGKERQLKLADWSYPSSSNAVRFGFAKTGCYTLTVRPDPFSNAKTVGGFATLTEAIEAGNKLPGAWHPFQSKVH